MKNLMILVVDDNLVSRLLPGFILRSTHPNVTVHKCESGEESLKVISSHYVTHLLLDISMPGLDGIQVAKFIRKKSKFKDICLIAYTADSLMADSQYYKSLGFDSILLKPLNRTELFNALSLKEQIDRFD
jgi:CheY-like chemotaxis protein